jgi:hypothetical protein
MCESNEFVAMERWPGCGTGFLKAEKSFDMIVNNEMTYETEVLRAFLRKETSPLPSMPM